MEGGDPFSFLFLFPLSCLSLLFARDTSQPTGQNKFTLSSFSLDP